MKGFAQKLIGAVVACAALATQAADTVTYFHNDLAGSPVAATDENRVVLWKESYRPYGERLTNSAAAQGNRVWFTSRRQDAETGLVYMGARYYDPVVGRFTSMDPVGFDDKNIHSHNRYAYANNNPYRYKDPDGKAAETVWDLASFGISVALFKNDPTLANFAGAAVDGIALAIPFVPGGVGAIRAVGKGADEAASLATKEVAEASKYLDTTFPGSVANRTTNVSRADFEKNLLGEGWSKSVSRDGKATIFSKDEAKYVVRDNAKSTAGPTADYYRPGSKEIDLKIRLD